MARHQLTKEERIKGLEKALASPKTPKQLLPALRERLEWLKKRRVP